METLINLVPNPVYRDVFPKNANVEKLAWIFDADYKSDSKENEELKLEIKRVVAKWTQKWKRGKNIPALRVLKDQNIFYLVDLQVQFKRRGFKS